MLISLSGTDGSGKSTQIDAISEFLRGAGKKVTRVWARGGYTAGFESLKRAVRHVLGRNIPKSGVSRQRQEILHKTTVSRLWLMLACLELIWLWGGFVRLQRLRGRIVICDRYIDDTRLDFRRNFPSVAFEKMLLWRALEWVTPRPDAAFLLWIPVEESVRRSQEKDEPYPDDEETLAWRLEAYMDESTFPTDRYIWLDCSRSVEVVYEEIVRKVGALLERGGRANAA